MDFEKFTGPEDQFAQNFQRQRDQIQQRGDNVKGDQQGSGDGTPERTRSEPRGRYSINLNEEQKPYKNNQFQLAEPVPAGKSKDLMISSNDYRAGDLSVGSKKSPNFQNR